MELRQSDAHELGHPSQEWGGDSFLLGDGRVDVFEGPAELANLSLKVG
jgi:hypothetical protein